MTSPYSATQNNAVGGELLTDTVNRRGVRLTLARLLYADGRPPRYRLLLHLPSPVGRLFLSESDAHAHLRAWSGQ